MKLGLLTSCAAIPWLTFVACGSDAVSPSAPCGGTASIAGAGNLAGAGPAGAPAGGASGAAQSGAAQGGTAQGGASAGSAGLGTAGASVGPTLAQLCAAAAGAGGAGGASGGAGGTGSGLSFTNQTYLADSRVSANEAVFSYINTVDDPHMQTLRLHNGGTAPVQIVSLQVVDNTLPPATNPSATPNAAGGTLFPPNYGQVSLPAAFKITPSAALPMALAAGADLDVTVQFLSSKTNPPDRMLNIGGQSASAVLVAQVAGGCVPAGLYGVSLWNNTETRSDPMTQLPTNNWARYEPTFGQVAATLGYKVNLGTPFIQLLNTNYMGLPTTGDSTEEVLVQKWVLADAGTPVQLLAVGRFAPPTDLPYGWYVIDSLTGTGTGGAAGGAGGNGGGGGTTAGQGGGAGSSGSAAGGAAGAGPTVTDAQPAAMGAQPAPLHVVATMSSPLPLGVDWDTSNYSEQILPPLKADSMATSFTPTTPTTPFGIWSFTNQRTTGGLTSAGVPAPNVGNGDYVYSEDKLNIDAAHSHRLRVYPLRNRAGALVPNSYLLGWEEASNGDYQDFIFILKNVKPAP